MRDSVFLDARSHSTEHGTLLCCLAFESAAQLTCVQLIHEMAVADGGGGEKRSGMTNSERLVTPCEWHHHIPTSLMVLGSTRVVTRVK